MRIRIHVALPVLVVSFAMSVASSGAQSAAVTGDVTAKGLRTNADVVVSLEASGLTVTPAPEPVEIDQKQMRFIPHVLPVTTGTTVQFLNSDAVAHNVFSPEGKYNLGTWPQGEVRDHLFAKAGVYTQLCRVHPEMEAFVVVLDTPYFTVTDKAGHYHIENVPPGTYTLVAWSEKLKTVRQAVTVEAGTPLAVNLTLSK